MAEKFEGGGQKPRIAVAGATGRVGSTLIKLLASDPVEVVVLTRRPDQVAPASGVAVAGIDFDRPDRLRDALQGADRVFIAHGTSPQQVAHEIALIDGAVSAGVRHIVKLSVLGPPTRLAPYAWHMAIEAHLAQQPVSSTVLRPTVFADVLKRYAGPIAANNWAGAAADGRINFIDTRDVAKVARVALLEQIGPSSSQRAYHLTGERAWTMQNIADQLSRLLDRPVIYHHRSPEEQRAALLADGLAPAVADLLVGLDQMFRDSVHSETTLTVKDLTGAAPRPLPEWLHENIAFFRDAARV
jgi:NAD(P)H dehydrogenase (quinone)